MKRPSFQFYPGDWQRNANLRRCSPSARGVWVDVMCLLHDSDEYGVLRWPLKEIAQASGASMAHVRELVDKSVLKGIDPKGAFPGFTYTPRSGRRDGTPVLLIPEQTGPIWFSSRMVKDEYVRTIRGESTRFGEGDGEASKTPPKDAPKASPKPPFGDGSSSASATAVNTEPKGSGGQPPKSAVDQSKTELWRSAVSLLSGQGMPEAQARTFIGKLSKDYPGADIVLEAVRGAVAEQPADARAYLKAACQRMNGERKRDGGADWTANAL